MDFLRRIRNSIYNPEFYKNLPAQPFPASLKYYYFLAANLALVLAVVFAAMFMPLLWAALRHLPAVADYYPAELIVTVQDGKAFANVAEPYALPLSDTLRREHKDAPQNLAVIDTEHAFLLEDFETYDTAVLLTEHHLVFADNDDLQVLSLSRFGGSLVVDKQFVHAAVDKIRSAARWGVPLLVLFIALLLFCGFFILWNVVMLSLIPGAVFIWLVGRVRKLGFGYKQSLQIGLHALTLPILYSALAFIGFPYIKFLSCILFAGVVLVNLVSFKPQPTVSTEHAA